MKTIERYVEFVYPGILFGDTSTARIEQDADIVIPDGAVGYRTFEQTATVVDGETLRGERANYSGWTYIGRRMTLDDVKREWPDAQTLIRNMEGNGWLTVCALGNGQAYPLSERDSVISRSEGVPS